MKRYYLVKVRYDNPRFPFRNQVFEAKSEEAAIEKYHASWRMKDGTNVDTDTIVSIEAEYLGISENISRFIEVVMGYVQYYTYVPLFMFFTVVELVFNYDPQMFKAAEARKDPYRRWLYWVSYLGRPLYWVRCLLGTRSKIWIDSEKNREV